ncbi:hypothetical protein FB45DRAFT_941110 [Roridomyces roridus]|uniref:BTB domain-containing protein n=1 Tax=Roridomyces roridus TaxID=1738132 RepID=A0AAD7B6U5_9AGAR|nr:hypothetical protein FB45DRAFT_941110 [Roridomyces roridus]
MQTDDTPHRTPELWFDDGNIVIQAENSQFRVHRGILAARSPVFRDMLSFPQPSDAELVEGCPLVCFHDSAVEVNVFLKAIFDSEFFMEHPSRTELETVVGVLRLSHKYEVPYLQRRALIHLSSPFCTTLSRYDRMVALADLAESGKDALEDHLPAKDTISWPTEVLDDETFFGVLIPLVREVGAIWVLPQLFYHLSARFKALAEEKILKIWTKIGINDQMTSFRGHEIQGQSLTVDVTTFLTDLIGDDCQSDRSCARARLFAIRITREVTRDLPSMPLEVWGAAEWEAFGTEVCRNCLVSLREKHRAARQAFWNKLPEMYKLPPWEELEKIKVEAIGKIF